MAYTNAQLRHEVCQARNAGKKQLIKRISEQQADFLREEGFKVEPYLYKIQTRAWKSSDDLQGVLKELHFLRKQGVTNCVRKLNKKDLKRLDEYHVRYEVIKYRIILR